MFENEIFVLFVFEIDFQFECCGVLGKTDFLGTKQWNRTNPWWTSQMPPNMKEFVYPLTCCPMNKSQENWHSLPLNQLQKAGFCALNGANIYETVSFVVFFR